MKEALVYLLAITIAETITVTIEPLWGVISHIIVLTVIVLRSALNSRQIQQQLLLSLALVPLVRIISLSMPLANIPQIWWYPIIYTPLLVVTIIVARILHLRINDIGLTFRLSRVKLLRWLHGNWERLHCESPNPHSPPATGLSPLG